MFIKKMNDENEHLSRTMERLFSKLEDHEPDSPEYSDTLEKLERLHKLRTPQKDAVSKDALIAVAGNLLGIGMILSYERVHIVTSKALSLIVKSRL